MTSTRDTHDTGAAGGRVVYLTGGGSGIGLATAQAFASAGATVCVADRDTEALNRLVDALAADPAARAAEGGSPVHTFACDLAEDDAADRFVRDALRTAGPPDTVVNCAGIALTGTVLETSLAEWDAIFAVNVRSVFLMSRATIPLMTAAEGRPGGNIVNVASEAGMVGFPQYAAYSASKAAVVNLTRSMALDCAPLGIRVNAVCPGSIETPLLRTFYEASGDAERARAEDVKTHPLGIGSPEDIATAITYLASQQASYVTGHALIVDGGYTAQ